MTRETLVHVACLYAPLVGSGMLIWWLRPNKQTATGLLFSCCWVLAWLPWLDGLARECGMWRYQAMGPSIAGLPLALYIGWCMAWGLFAPLLANLIGGRNWLIAALMLALDLRIMPELQPVLTLHPQWWIAELVMLTVLLIPALSMASWTASKTHIGLRCLMLAPSFGGMFIGLPLLIVCGDTAHLWSTLKQHSHFTNLAFGYGFALCALPGLTALQDLALSGKGTPVPLDPPQQLVTHGIYAYVRNPMQMSMTLILLLLSWYLMNAIPAILACVGMIYSEGLAKWSENVDMEKRFGSAWTTYRAQVRPWLPSWKPHIGEPCELWLNTDCAICCEIARWFKKRHPQKLTLCHAKQWKGPPLQRVTWHHPSSERMESGIRAIAMALQHLSLPWAIIGWVSSLPIFSSIIQMCFDAAGAGKIKPTPHPTMESTD
jgi:protein-S-isoprenylcysteine O-methyltransferase Ste14